MTANKLTRRASAAGESLHRYFGVQAVPSGDLSDAAAARRCLDAALMDRTAQTAPNTANDRVTEPPALISLSGIMLSYYCQDMPSVSDCAGTRWGG